MMFNIVALTSSMTKKIHKAVSHQLNNYSMTFQQQSFTSSVMEWLHKWGLTLLWNLFLFIL